MQALRDDAVRRYLERVCVEVWAGQDQPEVPRSWGWRFERSREGSVVGKSVPETMTLGLARVLDLAPVDRVLGDPIRVLLTPTPLPAREWDRLEALTEEEVDLRDEDPEASRRYRAGAMWQALGWDAACAGRLGAR